MEPALDDLMHRSFGPPDMRAASGGALNSNSLRIWNKQRYLVVPRRRAPRAGKAAEYKLIHVYIAVLLSVASRHGVSIRQGSLACRQRLGELVGATVGPTGAELAGFIHDPDKNFRDEFVDRDRARPWYWVLHYSDLDPLVSARTPTDIACCQAVRGSTSLHNALAGQAAERFVSMLNVTEILLASMRRFAGGWRNDNLVSSERFPW